MPKEDRCFPTENKTAEYPQDLCLRGVTRPFGRNNCDNPHVTLHGGHINKSRTQIEKGSSKVNSHPYAVRTATYRRGWKLESEQLMLKI